MATMTNYKFSMETILELRERTEKEEMEAMARIQNKLEIEKYEKLQLDEEKLESQKAKRLCQDFQQIRYYDLYLSKIDRELVDKTQKIEETEEKLEEQRDKLVEAQKDRKIMEKLREKEYEDYVQEIQRQEQMELDEIAVLKFNGPDNFD